MAISIFLPGSRMPDAMHSKTRRRAMPGDKLPTPSSQHNRHFSTTSSSICTQHMHTTHSNRCSHKVGSLI